MAVRIGHASIDEKGKAKGGAAGDQTGKEVKISNYYVSSKGWVVLRCKDADKRERIAQAAELACNNPQIGYDQYQRDTLYNNVKGSGFDPSKTTKKVETDCSALVRVCIAYAFGADVAGNIRTVNEPARLVATGHFTKLTDPKYCASSDYLRRGDILCTPVSGHTVVVLDDGAKAADDSVGAYSLDAFIRDVQKAIGAAVDGIAGDETIRKTPTVSAKKNPKHAVVRPIQNRLYALGYPAVGKADGIAGSKFTKAMKAFQKDAGCCIDGEAAEWGKTWHKLLGVGK